MLRRLLEIGRALVTERHTEPVLEQILAAGIEITGARYAALGVLDERRTELARFITAGLDHDKLLRTLGELPRGRGVLGVLIEDPRPLRLTDVSSHPQSYGFPPGHPPMRSFLGVPIMIRGQAWGNLYLTEKQGGEEFTAVDEEAAVALAQWAATAIENARLYEASERRREEAERALQGLEAARSIADAVAGVDDLDQVLELIAKRGRALVDAQSVLIMLREGDELVVAASAGHVSDSLGKRLPISGSTSGQVLQRGRPERVPDVMARLRIAPAQLGVADAHTALLVPMLHRGTAIGMLAAFDRGAEGASFAPHHEQLMATFGIQAANAVAIRRGVEAGRLRSAIEAADSERRRWARELHDQTLQALGGLRVLLASTVGKGDAASRDGAIRQAIEDTEVEIENLRALISDLRPSLLDDLGLQPALEALIDRRRAAGLQITSELYLPGAQREGARLAPELETAIYRVVQESLTNVVKHAQAATVRVAVKQAGNQLTIEVHDDGVGFDDTAQTAGFGLAGMRERVYLAGGMLRIEAGEQGTLVSARLPIGAADGTASSGADQAAPERKLDELRPGRQPELPVDPGAMRLDRSAR
ncbi:MAG: GAF domain-containing protein [Solirubrobacteraceae bacterium]